MKKKLRCIMLIDDNKADNHYHRIIIEDMFIAHQTEVALDGVEALKYLDSENHCLPELIFLDINMPKMNGWEFLEAYREISTRKSFQSVIVILTTSQNPEDEKKSKSYPEVACYRTKPLSEEMLNEILEKFFPD